MTINAPMTPEGHIKRAVNPVVEAFRSYASSTAGRTYSHWNICVVMPIELAVELTARVVALRRREGGEDTADRLVASVITRYLFELAANIGVMLNTAPVRLRMRRQIQWRRLRQMAVFGDSTYGVQMQDLRVSARHSLQKKSQRPRIFLKKYGRSKAREVVRVIDDAFRFNDPWGMSMAAKVALIPLQDEKYFMDRWKLYSHISHGSAFSIWPRWLDPVPEFDAVQCLGTIAKMVATFVGQPFDLKGFLEKSWLLMATASE